MKDGGCFDLQSTADCTAADDFERYLKPRVADFLKIANLDKTYTRANGDFLYYKDTDSRSGEIEVLDLVGGFGSCLFGHNHPVLLATIKQAYEESIPTMVQASVRSDAAVLARQLSSLFEKRTGERWITTLSNSGTESVEAAVKHAAYAWENQVSIAAGKEKNLLKRLVSSCDRVEQVVAQLPTELLTQNLPGVELTELQQWSGTKLIRRYLAGFRDALDAGKHIVSLEGGFHGKTSGSVKLTHNEKFRAPWERFGITSIFLPRNDLEALSTHTRESVRNVKRLHLTDNGGVVAHDQNWCHIFAAIVEPIQGEGGILALENEFLTTLAAEAKSFGFPLIVDEIQTGMGRTGAFLASDFTGVYGDIFTLSKSLGGGLVKIGATLIRESEYIREFGYLHSSTFAEDGVSSRVAMKCLELLEVDDLANSCSKKGEILLSSLNRLKSEYPEFIGDVRGRGLMIGIALKELSKVDSPLVRELSSQELIGYFLSGYFLNKYNIRVAPTFSAPNTLRLEPSAYVSTDSINYFISSLSEVLALMRNQQWQNLFSVVFNYRAEQWAGVPSNLDVLGSHRGIQTDRPKVACVAHFIEAEDIGHWDPFIGRISRRDAEQMLNKAYQVIEPFITQRLLVEDVHGQSVDMTVYGLPLSTKGIVNLVKDGKGPELVSVIESCVEQAYEWGAKTVGFAGHTSIVTNNCQLLDCSDVGLTSGNSLTAAAAVTGIYQACIESDIEIKTATVGVIGAVGNIGQVIASILGSKCSQVKLFGRVGSERRLQKFKIALERSEPNLVVMISTDISEVSDCDIIFSATNAAIPIISKDVLGKHPMVICDIAVPGDVDLASVAGMPNVSIIRGGVIHLPENNKISLLGSGLGPGEVWACVAEVMLLGLAGETEDYSVGLLEVSRVENMLELASYHGFDLTPKYIV